MRNNGLVNINFAPLLSGRTGKHSVLLSEVPRVVCLAGESESESESLQGLTSDKYRGTEQQRSGFILMSSIYVRSV